MDHETNRVEIKRENPETGRDLAVVTKVGCLAEVGRFSEGRVVIKTEEQCSKCEEHMKTIKDKNVSIAELFKKLMYMKNDLLLERDRTNSMGVCSEQLKGFETREAQLKEEIEQLKLQKTNDYELIEQLGFQKKGIEEQYDHIVAELGLYKVEIEELKRQKSKDYKIIEELGQQKMEIEAAAEMQRKSHDVKVEEMGRKLLEAECREKELRDTVVGLRGRFPELEERENLLRRLLSDSEEREKGLRGRLSEFEEIERGLRGQLSEFEELEKGLRHRLSEFEELEKGLRGRLFEYEEIVKGLTGRLSEFEKTEKRLRDRLSESEIMEKVLRAKNKEACGTIEQLSSQKMEANQLNEGLRSRLSESEERENVARGRLSEFEETEKSLRGRLSEFEELEKGLRGRLSEFEEIEKGLRGRLSESEKIEEELRAKNKEACETIEQLSLQKVEANHLIGGLRARLLESEKMEKVLLSRAKNVEANGTIEKLNLQLSAAEAHIVKYIETVKEMGQKQLETDQIVAELGRQKKEVEEAAEKQRKSYEEEMGRKLLEAETREKELRETVKGLEKQNFAAYKAADIFRKKYDDLVPMTVQLGNLVNAKIDGAVNLEKNGTVGSSRKRGPALGLIDNRCTTPRERGTTSCSREIIDCDDETKPDKAALIGHEKIANSTDQANKQKRTLLESSVTTPSRKRRKLENENEISPINGALIDARNQESKHSSSSKAWTLASDMIIAFEENDELCLDAVCALYRQLVSSPKSTRAFDHFEKMRGSDMAEYMIDGDKEWRRTKSVSEVKERFPDAIKECRILAVDYFEELFMSYCNGEDPLFGPI